jgi:hypothetical protein
MTISAEERSRINKRNASHARGPATEAGRNKSKYNALKHGGRAETLVLPNESPDDVRALFDQWDGFYRPRSPAEAAYIDKAVLSLQKAERLRRAEHQAIADQVRSAEHRYDEAQQREVDRFGDLLKEDPAEAVRGLMGSAAGCRWMLEQWDYLKTELAERGAWVSSQRETATRLMGLRPEAYREDDTVYLIRLWNGVAFPNRNEEALDLLLSPPQVPDTIRSWQANWEPDVADCRRNLTEAVDREVAALREREEYLRTAIEGPARAGAAERALVLEGPEGQRLHRYQVTAENDFHRAYQGFLKARAKEQELVETAPPAPLPNEPNPPVVPDATGTSITTSAESPPCPPEPGGPPSAGPGGPLPNEPKSAPGERAEAATAEPPSLPILLPAAGINPETLAASAPTG